MVADPQEALRRLKEGNLRYTEGRGNDFSDHRASREAAASGQHPFAIVLGCADSRVPPEFVFDHGLGELFVVRVAGNIAAPSQLGSIEYAVEHFGSSLVVVLGHSGCGAVTAALGQVDSGVVGEQFPGELGSIVDRITPALAGLPEGSAEERMNAAVTANVQSSVATLGKDPELASCVSSGALQIIGAEYSLATGQVSFHEAS